MPIVPCPAITPGRRRVHEGQLLRLFEFERMRVGLVIGIAGKHHFAAAVLHRLILICGVVVGITITARQPIFAAESATPWAWLPAEAQITPRFASARA